MPDPTISPLDRNLTGQPIAAQGFTLTPVARLTGWEWGAPGRGGLGVLARLNPTEVRVAAPDGAESTLSLVNSDFQSVRGMFAGAAAIAVVCSLIMLLARLWGWRRAA